MQRYPIYDSYRPSKLPWSPEIPSGWQVRKLTHSISYTVGFTPESGNPAFYGDEYLWANISDLGPRQIVSTKRCITKEAVDVYKKVPAKKGSLLYSFKLSVGQVSFAGTKMFTNEAIAAFEESEKIKLEFFYYLAPLAIVQAASENIYGAKILNQESIDNAKLIIPPISEQRAIARFLDYKTAQIDALIVRKQALLEKLAEKRSALISHAVTKGLDPSVPMKDSGVAWLGEIPAHWRVLPLRRLVFAVKTGTTPHQVNDAHFEVDGLQWIRPGDFSGSMLLDRAENNLSVEGRAAVRVFPAGTVMHVGIGATIGKVGVTTREASCNQQVNAIVCNENLNNFFAAYFLQSIQQFIVKCGKYTTLPILNQDETKGLLFSVPPVEEQLEIVDYLSTHIESIKRQKGKIDHVIAKLWEYRSALITNAVTGKIDVRGFKLPEAADETAHA